jgi:hypothetical protein
VQPKKARSKLVELMIHTRELSLPGGLAAIEKKALEEQEKEQKEHRVLPTQIESIQKKV